MTPLEIIDLSRALELLPRSTVVALTALDGVSRGHERLIARAAARARQFGAPLVVVSFAPSEPHRLMTSAQQARAMGRLGADFFCPLPFDAQMDGLADEILTQALLVEQLAARHVMVGADVARAVSARFARATGEGANRGYSVVTPAEAGLTEPEFGDRNAAKAAVRAGRPDLAKQIMGRPFSIEGVVVEGQKLGRQLGFPTANVMAGDYVRPRLGAYATISRLADGRELPGVANFGVNPTTGLVEARLEVWLFDFDEDIYGRTLETDLVAFLRPELKFDGLPALIQQIATDADDARAVLAPEVRRAALG